MSNNCQGFNLSINLALNLLLSQINLAKIYINFAFAKMIYFIEDRENQGDYFEIFRLVTCGVCLISQLPNIYSLKKTFEVSITSVKNQKS